MPQSLSRILVHLVFSTKNREQILTAAIQSEVHPYLSAILNNIECPSLQVGGVEDHVHLFFGLSRKRTVAEVVETLKTIPPNGSKPRTRNWRVSIGKLGMRHSPLANPMLRTW